jgi:hypothetical protein
MIITSRILVPAVLAIAGVMATTAAVPAMAAQPGTTYESLKALPDFTGAWTPLTPPFVMAPKAPPAPASAPPPDSKQLLIQGACVLGTPSGISKEAIQRCQQFMEARFGGAEDRGYCMRPSFNGRPPAGAGGALEVLFTPGRVTLAVESGLVRRIYLRDRPPADALDESRSGTSIGRWDGATLIVETTGLDPGAMVMPGLTLGRKARVRERISLKDADTLEIESTISAPAIQPAPLVSRQTYRRARDRMFTEFDACVEGDRAFDRSSGTERFDVTPPDDLPPPPGN